MGEDIKSQANGKKIVGFLPVCANRQSTDCIVVAQDTCQERRGLSERGHRRFASRVGDVSLVTARPDAAARRPERVVG